MDTAVEDGHLRSNPVNIRRAAREETYEGLLPTYADVARLADEIEPRFRALVWLAATSGLRHGELSGLARRHVDRDHSTIRVDRALTFEKGVGATFGKPKTASAHRTVVIPESTAALLRAHLDEFTEEDRDALVFTSVKGRPLLYRYFTPYWKRAKANADVDPNVRFLSLRHLSSTTAASARASIKELMARMGHVVPFARSLRRRGCVALAHDTPLPHL